MSRHRIPAHIPKHEVFVGWDHPLLTFFGQVYDHSLGEAKNPIHWVFGYRPQELYEVENLVKAMRKFAEITPEMRARLYGDKDEGL